MDEPDPTSEESNEAEAEGIVAPELPASDMQAIAHLYRAEVARAVAWRTRLDATTNWAVALTGVALSVTFASHEASPLPLLLTAFLVLVFLGMEARRYRYYDIWQTRVRLLEMCFYGPILRREEGGPQQDWLKVLAKDYARVRYHISALDAVARRVRRNYGWILLSLAIAYVAKTSIHPTPIETTGELVARMRIGPIPGEAVAIGSTLVAVALVTIALVYRTPGDSAQIEGLDEEDPIRKFGLDF